MPHNEKFKGLIFEQIQNHNLETAVKVQNQIFPHEDARKNFVDSINHAPYRKDLIFWLIRNNDEYVGVVGLYSYPQYPDNAWLGWFGIIDKHRRKGYASIAFEFFENQAKNKGYHTARLYTDDEDNKDAVSFYKKMGMTEEIYSNPNDVFTTVGKTIIFSKSLNSSPLEPWDNRILDLNQQEARQNAYK